MRGELNRAAPELYTRFTLYPDGRTDIVTTGEEAEFPRIAPAGDRQAHSVRLPRRAIEPTGPCSLSRAR